MIAWKLDNNIFSIFIRYSIEHRSVEFLILPILRYFTIECRTINFHGKQLNECKHESFWYAADFLVPNKHYVFTAIFHGKWILFECKHPRKCSNEYSVELIFWSKRMHYIYIGQTTQKLQGKQCKRCGTLFIFRAQNMSSKDQRKKLYLCNVGTTEIKTITNN